MLKFSADPNTAEQQMNAIIFYLTAFGYIDGNFDRSEKTFVKMYIRRLVEARASDAMPQANSDTREAVTKKFVAHFHEVFESIDADIKELFTEVVADGEDVNGFVYSKLKLRSYEIFRSFDQDNQLALLQTVDELIYADGTVHEAEAKFREDLQRLLEANVPDEYEELDLAELTEEGELEIQAPARLQPRANNHPFFGQFEHHYSADPVRIRQQAQADHKLITETMKKFAAQRGAGTGQLAGKSNVGELAGEKPFLDGHVYVHPRDPEQAYELTVLGDLHGCYSCLKAAVMQSDFLAKVEAYRSDPQNNANPKLVFLGDYIDRGRFSYNGVLRTVMQLFNAAPDHVFVLRGNHEYYIEYKGNIYGGVKPAEAINSLMGHMPKEMFETYRQFFESMPNMLLFDRILFVHAGIPRDATIRDKYTDLSSLNDPDIRFQMLWSDPSEADHIPEELQAQNARFPFGRSQYERFMAMLGCTSMVRGHEKVVDGFVSVYPLGNVPLLNLFSAGGKTNLDLPDNSSYRTVTPMALTIKITHDNVTSMTPWVIDYERYNTAETNAFFASPPEITHKVG